MMCCALVPFTQKFNNTVRSERSRSHQILFLSKLIYGDVHKALRLKFDPDIFLFDFEVNTLFNLYFRPFRAGNVGSKDINEY